ncbi:hypothetical protein L543_3849 [Bordetella hinzii L60]|nr:hypothetical protein L543_3849 [Bordetella hinzii L60]
MHVHGIVDRQAQPLGGVVFHDGRHHGRFMALVERRAGQAARRLDQIGMAGQAGEFFLHALETAHGDAELAPHARIHAGGVGAHDGAGGRQRGQRDATARGQGAHQHLPALASPGRPADQGLDGHEDVAPLVGAVLEDLHGRQMAAADLHARRIGGHQGHRNAHVLGAAQQALGVAQLERQAQHGGHRPQRDVALVPIQPDAQQILAIDHLAAHHAGIGHGGGIGPGLGAGEPEAGNLAAVGQARQPEFPLRGRAELQQQFARAQRIGHHDGDAGRDRIRRHPPHDLGMRVGRKAQAAVFLGNDHAEEALASHQVPDLGRQIAALPFDVPFVQQRAQARHRPFDEQAFFVAERGRRHGEQFVPIGVASEEIAVPPDIAGLDGLAFGIGQAWQGGAGPAIGGFGYAPAAPIREARSQTHG